MNRVEKVYASEASKHHYFQSRRIEISECQGPSPAKSIDSDSQVEKFYRKYGKDWLTRFRLNEGGDAEGP